MQNSILTMCNPKIMVDMKTAMKFETCGDLGVTELKS